MALVVVVAGNAGTATKLKNARKINGTNFDGSEDITTSKWGNERKLTLSGAVSGSANIDGSGDVVINTIQNNIAILTGSLTVTKSSDPGNSYNQTVKNINYPSGFNKDNSVVIAFGSTRNTETKGYSYDASVNIAFTSPALNTGNIPREVQLNNANIKLCFYSLSSDDLIINYKIILLKVS